MNNSDTLTPKLRFPEFRKGPAWVKKMIGDLLQETTRPIDMVDNKVYRL